MAQTQSACFGCIESDSLSNTTWQHFPKLSFQIKTDSNTETNQLAPETVSPATQYPIPGLLSKYEPIFDFLSGLQGFSDLRLISDQQNLLPGFSLGVYIVFQEINCHLAVLSSRLPSSAQFTFSGSQNKVGSWEYDQNPLN